MFEKFLNTNYVQKEFGYEDTDKDERQLRLLTANINHFVKTDVSKMHKTDDALDLIKAILVNAKKNKVISDYSVEETLIWGARNSYERLFKVKMVGARTGKVTNTEHRTGTLY